MRPLAAAGLLAALCGCAAPPLLPVVAPWPESFKEAPAHASAQAEGLALAMPVDGAWWRAFEDPLLDTLIERASRDNSGIAAAAARVAVARALLRGAEAQRAPQVGLGASLNRQGGPLINAAGSSGNLITATASVSYEVDLFGRLSGAAEAASLDVLSREALWRAARLVVQADVAQAYLALRALDAERAAARATALAWQETLRLSDLRVRSGALAEAALAGLRSEGAAADAEVLVLTRRHAEQEHALALLLGLAPSQFSLDDVSATASASRPASLALPQVPAGIPSEMLARRPDVAAAQSAVAAAQARAGVARNAWWPSLALTASGGQASPDLADLLRASTRAFGLAAVLAAPLFDGGRREAGMQQADAELAAQLAAQRATVLNALREVEDPLSTLHGLAEEAPLRQRAQAAASHALASAQSRHRSGLASQLEVIDALRSALRSRRALLAVQAAQAQATVALIRALGGGWGAAPIAAPASITLQAPHAPHASAGPS